jgi:hypothetical protein
VIGLSKVQTRLECLEEMQRRRQAEVLLDELSGLLDASGGREVGPPSDRDTAVATVFWYLLATRPPGPTLEDLDALVRFLRKQAVAHRYRPMLYRAQAAIAATEAGRLDPLFDRFFEWFDVDDAPGAGRCRTEEHDPTLARIQPARQPAGLPAISLRTATSLG